MSRINKYCASKRIVLNFREKGFLTIQTKSGNPLVSAFFECHDFPKKCVRLTISCEFLDSED